MCFARECTRYLLMSLKPTATKHILPFVICREKKTTYLSCTVLPLVTSKIFWCINLFFLKWSWELLPNDCMCKRLHLYLWEVIKNPEYEIFGHLSSLYVLEFSHTKCSLFLLSLFLISSIFLLNWHIWKCKQTFEIKSRVVKR